MSPIKLSGVPVRVNLLTCGALTPAATRFDSAGRPENDDMDRDSVERLRFDRRLQRRREWLAEGEYEAFVESLPDASDKMMRIGDESESTTDQAGGPSASGAEGGSPDGGSAGSFPPPGGSSTPA